MSASAASARAFAPAKVNLFLHVGAPTADGYHPLSSLMVFADVGDTLRLLPAPRGAGLGLHVAGEFAGALAGEAASDNLVLRGVRRLLQRAGRPEPDVQFVLDKALPVAAGLGGGSSDAGAALRLARAAFAPEVDDAGMEAVAAELGADGPACLRAAPVLGLGRGDELRPAPRLPALHAVLVNPRVACPTGAVYRAYDAAAAFGGAEPAALEDGASSEDLFSALAVARNDLEAPAIGVAPVIAHVLEALRTRPEVALAHLSGSGATAFGLCRSAGDAEAAALALAADPRGWWVRATRLGGPWSAEGT
ncbi:MAG: 4-(cytidine 5'-diphospho)-2-C-methyl-D-erythritol kinase [Caulobacteraceae bacterium]|nr:4-(cytidine 5'-diphospho)-2-C-methyl-D-erythritol kinase [Caulobacter sp.]